MDYRSGYLVRLIEPKTHLVHSSVRTSRLGYLGQNIPDEEFIGYYLYVSMIGMSIDPYNMNRDNLVHQYLVQSDSQTVNGVKETIYQIISDGVDPEQDVINLINEAINWDAFEENDDDNEVSYRLYPDRHLGNPVNLDKIPYFGKRFRAKSARKVVR